MSGTGTSHSSSTAIHVHSRTIPTINVSGIVVYWHSRVCIGRKDRQVERGAGNAINAEQIAKKARLEKPHI